jgi:hypothetical protein
MSASLRGETVKSVPDNSSCGIPCTCAVGLGFESRQAKTVFKKEVEYRTPLVADGDFGEAAITIEHPKKVSLLYNRNSSK